MALFWNSGVGGAAHSFVVRCFSFTETLGSVSHWVSTALASFLEFRCRWARLGSFRQGVQRPAPGALWLRFVFLLDVIH
jgi:hypothetical protein